MRKEQVNLCLVEEVSNDNYFYKSINCERSQQIEVHAKRYPCDHSRYRFYTSQSRHIRFLSLQPVSNVACGPGYLRSVARAGNVATGPDSLRSVARAGKHMKYAYTARIASLIGICPDYNSIPCNLTLLNSHCNHIARENKYANRFKTQYSPFSRNNDDAI